MPNTTPEIRGDQPTSDANSTRAGRLSRVVWRLVCGLFLAAAACYLVYIFLIAFRLPTSRIYSSRVGYPALMRLVKKPIEVKVAAARVRPMVNTLSAEGTIAYLHEVPVNSEVQGIVMNILVEPGKEVRRGDVVIRINTGGHVTRTVELNRELARAEVEIARLQEKREKELVLAHAASQRDLELAILGVKHAEDALAVAEENYRNSLLTRSKLVIEGDAAVARDPKGREIDLLATISGTVFELNVQPGENLDPLQDQKNLLIIGDQLMFTAYFDQRYASSVRKGDKGKFYLRAYPGTLFEGEVVRVDAEVLPQTPKSEMLAATEYPFTFRIWMSCPASKGSQRKIMRGMNGYCLFERQFSSVAIPESALMRYSGRAGTVLAVDANRRLQVRNVTYSMADDGWVAIETGLKAKDLVVLDGQIALKPGDQVVAVQEK